MATDSPTRDKMQYGAPLPEAIFVVPSPLNGERDRVRSEGDRKLSTFNVQHPTPNICARQHRSTLNVECSMFDVFPRSHPSPLIRLPVGERGKAQWTSLVDCRLIWLIPIILLFFTSGCSTTPRTQIHRPAGSVPTDALITQRGVLTVLGRQFTLNGYLSISATGGKRLIVTENFGGVLADVLIKPDGTVHVMRSSRAFKPKWIRRYVAADVECLFGNTPKADCPGEMLSANHFLIKRRWYKLDLQIVETKPGPQPATMFDESKAEKP